MVYSLVIACSILSGHTTCNQSILLNNLDLKPNTNSDNTYNSERSKNKMVIVKNKYCDNIKQYFMKKFKLNIFNKRHHNNRF